MAEKITLTTPVPQATEAQLVRLDLRWPNRIHIVLALDNGQRYMYRIIGEDAQTVMTNLNTADLSTSSLKERILQYLVANGYIDGTA